MTPNLNQYVNKSILVSIPALFDDGACRPYTLLGADVTGLWLYSEELTRRLLAEDERGYSSAGPVVFVPFAQIAAVLVATTVPASPAGPSKSPVVSTQAKRKK